MPFFSRKKLSSDDPPANELTAQSTQQPRIVCTWSARVPRSGPSPLPFPRHSHTLTTTATADGELFLFGGYVNRSSSDLYLFSTRDFSTTLLQTSGEVPSPRYSHGSTLIGTTFLICGGTTFGHDKVLNYDLLYLLNLGTLYPLMSCPTPTDHRFVLQYRESGPALWSMVPHRAVVTARPQPWSVPSTSSSVVALAGQPRMICGHSIRTVV